MPTASIITNNNKHLAVDLRADGVYLGELKLASVDDTTGLDEALRRARKLVQDEGIEPDEN